MPLPHEVQTITTDVQRPAAAGTDPLDRPVVRLNHLTALDEAERVALRRALRRTPLLPPYVELLRDAPRDVSFLLTGLACRFRLLSNGRRQITGFIVPGDICDFGFLTGNQTLGQFMTLTNSVAGRVSAQAYLELLEDNPRLMRATLRAAATETAIAQERVITLGSRIAIERVAHLLCEMWYRLDVVGLVSEGDTYEFAVTQAEMGEALGLSTVHVNRTLQIMRKNGIFAMAGGKVTITNLHRLHELAGFDAAFLRPVEMG